MPRVVSNPYRRKASSLRSSWTARAKKYSLPTKSIPTLDVLEAWLKRQNPFTCAYSFKPVKTWEVDHACPISRAGSFSTRNLRIASKEMNALKGALNEDEFRSLLNLINQWSEEGRNIFIKRLKQSGTIFGRRKR